MNRFALSAPATEAREGEQKPRGETCLLFPQSPQTRTSSPSRTRYHYRTQCPAYPPGPSWWQRPRIRAPSTPTPSTPGSLWYGRRPAKPRGHSTKTRSPVQQGFRITELPAGTSRFCNAKVHYCCCACGAPLSRIEHPQLRSFCAVDTILP